MSISKSDFKTIYNKMINSDNTTVKKYINNLNRYGKTGDARIDELVRNYSPSYVTKVMNKINTKILVGGSNGSNDSGVNGLLPETTERSTENNMNGISIVDNANGTVSQVPVTSVSSPSRSSPMMTPPSRSSPMVTSPSRHILSDTSSEMPSLGNTETTLEMPSFVNLPQSPSTNDLISSNTSTEVPSINLHQELSTTSENPVVESKTIDMKMSVSEMIEKLKHKAMLLKQKEDELKSREARLEELERNVVDKRKQKEDLDSEIEILQNQQNTLKTNIGEIEQLLTESEIEPGTSFLQNIVNKVTGVFSQ